jgi:hypothetical protein
MSDIFAVANCEPKMSIGLQVQPEFYRPHTRRPKIRIEPPGQLRPIQPPITV